jgi:hypothetical protein
MAKLKVSRSVRLKHTIPDFGKTVKSAGEVEAYIRAFERFNSLKQAPYYYRGRIINEG